MRYRLRLMHQHLEKGDLPACLLELEQVRIELDYLEEYLPHEDDERKP